MRSESAGSVAMCHRRALGLLFCGVLLVSQRCQGQPSPDAVLPESATRRAFVPLEELDVLLGRDQRGVVLSRDEYTRLMELVKTHAGEFPRANEAMVLSTGDYTAEATDEQLVLTVMLDVQQLKPGWQAVSLPFRNVAVEHAALDGQPALLGRATGNRELVLFTSQPGRHSLELKLSTPLVRAGSDRVSAIGMPPVAAATFQMALDPEQFLHVDEVALERPAAADQPARYSFAAGGRSEISLRITGREMRRHSASLLFAETVLGMEVGADEQTWDAVTTLDVYGKPIDRVQLAVPRTLEIVSVDSTGLERWEIEQASAESSAAVNLIYRQPFAGARPVTLRGVASSKTGEPWRVPTLVVTGAVSHLVQIVIQHASELRLRPVEADGVRRIVGNEAARPVETSPTPESTSERADSRTQRFTAWRQDFTLSLTTQPRVRELLATIASRVDVRAEELSLRSSIVARSHFAPLFELDLALPVDWTVSHVVVGNQPAPWRLIPVDAQSNRVQVLFQPPIPIDGHANLTLAARRIPSEAGAIGDDSLVVPLPEVYLPQAGVTDGRYMLAADDDLMLTVDELEGLDPVRLSEKELRLARAPRLAYEYQDTRFKGKLRVARKALRLVARTLAFHRLDQDALVSHLEARIVASGGGMQKLEVVLPEQAGADLRFRLTNPSQHDDPPRITEQTSAPPVNGERLWTLRFDRRVIGGLWLVVDLATPRTPESQEFALPVLQIHGAERQFGEVAVEAAPDQLLRLTAVDAAGQPLREIAPSDIGAPLEYDIRQRIVAAYQAVRGDYRITISESRFEQQAVPTAICDDANLTTIVGETGEMHHEAEFNFRATGVQALQVELPRGATLWSTLIDGKPMEVRVAPGAAQDLPTYVIPLPAVADPIAPRILRIFYRTTANGWPGAGAYRQAPPRVMVVGGQGEMQHLEILERDWTLFHPAGTTLTSSKGQFEFVERPTHSGPLGWLQRSVRFDEHDLALKGLVIAVAAVMIGVLWLAGRRRGTVGLVTAGLVGAALVVIAGLAVPMLHSGREASQRPQATSNLRQMGLALKNYHDASESFMGQSPATANDSADFAGEFEKGPFFDADGGEPNIAFGGGIRVGTDNRGPATEDFEMRGRALSSRRELGKRLSRKNRAMAGVPIDGKPGFVGGLIAAQPHLIAGQAAPEQQPAEAEAKRAAGKGINVGEPRGLLSLEMDLEPESDSRTARFHYSGGSPTGHEPELHIEFRSRRGLLLTGVAWACGAILLFWFARKWSTGRKATLAVLGLFGPVALAPLAPIDLLAVLEGLFLGTFSGCVLWALLSLVSHRDQIGDALKASVSVKNAALGVTFVACLSSAEVDIAFGGQGGSTPPSSSADANPSARGDDARSTPPPLVVLYDPAGDPDQSQRIFLPFDQFVKLWNAAHPERPADSAAPRDGLVAEALYAAQLVPGADGKSATIAVTARFVLHSFRREQVAVPLPVGRVPLTQAKLNGKPAPLVTRVDGDQPELSVIVSESGTHILDAQFSVPAEVNAAGGSFTLPLRPVPAGALRFTLPAPDLALRVAGVNGAFRRAKEQDQTTALVPIDAGGDVTLAWTPARTRAAQDSLVQVLSTTALRLDDAGLKLHGHFQFTVRQGTLSEASFDLPPELFVRKIGGPDVAGWEFAGDGPQRSLTVYLRRPVEDSTALQFDLFQPLSFTEQATSVAVPQFAPRGVTRESGTVGIAAAEPLNVTAGPVTGGVQMETADFAWPKSPIDASRTQQTASAMPVRFAYRFAANPFSLSFQVERRRSYLAGVAEHGCYVTARNVRVVSRLGLQLSGAPRSEISIRLPNGYFLTDLKSNGSIDYHIDAPPDGGPSVLSVELAAPRTGAVELILEGVVSRSVDDLLPVVAGPVPLGVGELKTAMAVWIDPSFSATVESADGWNAADPERLSARLKSTRNSPVQLAFVSNVAAVEPLVLGLSPVPGRLSGEALSVIIVRDTAVEYALYLRWRIAQGVESKFIFTTPDWLADRLEIDRQLPGLRVRQVSSEKTSGNRLRWTVTLDEPRATALMLSAQAVLPPPEAARIAAPLVIFEQAAGNENASELRPLESQRLHLLLINQSPHRLDRDASEGSADLISAQDLPIRVGTQISDQAAEVLAVRDAKADVGWKVLSMAAVKGVPASVNLARLTLIIASDGSWRELVECRVNNRSRQFLAIRKPANSRVLSLFVANQPARPVRPNRTGDPDVLLLPLPKTAAGELSAEIRLVLTGQFDAPLPRGLQVLRTALDLPAPHILSQREDAEFGAPVAATEWTVVLPEDIDARRIDDPDRSNMAYGSEGTEQLIALYQELLSLKTIVADETQLSGAQDRARYNMQQLSKALRETNVKVATSKDDRQARQLAELESRIEAVPSNPSATPASNESPVPRPAPRALLSNRQLQREILKNNADFAQQERVSETEELQLGIADSNTVLPPSEAQKSAAGSMIQKRSDLKKETAIQSAELNTAAAHPEGSPQAPDAAIPADPAAAPRSPQETSPVDRKSPLSKDEQHSKSPVVDPGAAFPGASSAASPQTGGLSLAINLPADGQRLTFAKPGGDPKLALGLRPKTAHETAIRLTWAVVWLVMALALISAQGRRGATPSLRNRAARGAAVAGLVWFVFLPVPVAGLGLFLVGALFLVWNRRRTG